MRPPEEKSAIDRHIDGKQKKMNEKLKRKRGRLQMRWGYAMIRERGGKTCEKNLYDPERFKIL